MDHQSSLPAVAFEKMFFISAGIFGSSRLMSRNLTSFSRWRFAIVAGSTRVRGP